MLNQIIKSKVIVVWIVASVFMGLCGCVGRKADAPTGPAKVKHVVHVSVDGLSGILLEQAMTNWPGKYKNFERLMRESSRTLNARCDYTKSETLPNHTCMITSRPVDPVEGQPATIHHGFGANTMKSGWTLHNQGNQAVKYIPGVFDVVHDQGLSTMLLAGKEKFSIYSESYNVTNGAPDTVGQDNGRNKIDHVLIRPPATAPLVEAWLKQISIAAPTYTFLHMVEPDSVGHAKGWGSSEWFTCLSEVDLQIGRVLDALSTNPALQGQTALLVTADHGGGVPAKSHGDSTQRINYTIPFFAWGPGWPAGGDLYQVYKNRKDPAQGRPKYSDLDQPVRNGDAGNLALQLLGLPSIPGSLIKPVY